MAARNNSVASQSANIHQRANEISRQVQAEQGWLESKLKPTKINARYPVKGNPLLFATCGFGSLGDALFGYNSGELSRNTKVLFTDRDTTGIMSGLLVNPVFIKRFFSEFGGAQGSLATVNPSITGISVACLQASAAVGALIAGRLGDMIGRKRTVRVGGFIYFFSAFIQMFAPGFATFVAGRTIQGLGVGFLSMTVPVIQTEIAAPHARGLMVGIEYTFLIAGYMLSCWVDYGFHFLLPDNLSWQGPFIIQTVLSLVLFVMSFFLPETPRWLAKNGFMKESLQTVADLHSNGDIEDEQVQKVFLEIQEAVVYEAELGQAGWFVSCSWKSRKRFITDSIQEMFTRYRKRTIVGITVQMFAQLNGINIISFYLPSTLSKAGFNQEKSLLYTAANALPYTAATMATWWLADHWGRKPLLILGGVMMAVLLGIVCAFTEAHMPIMTRANGQYAFIMLYNIVYGFTWGPMPWLLPGK